MSAAAVGASHSEYPLTYLIDRVARRYGVAPWVFDTDDETISRWLARGLLFDRFDREAGKG